MTVADIIWEDPEPPLLHTEETFRAVRAPDPSEGGAAAHWHVFFSTLSMALRSFGFPDALYDKWLTRNSQRRDAFNVLRLLEAMLRRILLMLAAADTRPLTPALPRKTRSPAAAPAPTGKARKVFRGKPPEKLPIHFALVPPAAIAQVYVKPAPEPLTGVLLILEEQRRALRSVDPHVRQPRFSCDAVAPETDGGAGAPGRCDLYTDADPQRPPHGSAGRGAGRIV